MPQHDRLDLARVLLARAEDDETLIRKVSSDTDIADAIVGFHAQQAAEKSIKAVLAARGVSFVKSHALGYLIGLVEENDVEGPDELSEADVLSPWAVEFRYEGEEPPALDRPAALRLVSELRTWAEREIEAAERLSKSEESEEEHEPEEEQRP
jgi:HEPN domain-containing protein